MSDHICGNCGCDLDDHNHPEAVPAFGSCGSCGDCEGWK